MNQNNIGTQLQTISLLPAQSVAVDGNGTGVDITQFTGELAVFLACKNTAGTTPTLDIKLQESDTLGSGYTDISGAAFTQVTDANTAAAVLLKVTLQADPLKKYLRAVADISGTNSPAFITSCFAVGLKHVN